MSIIAQIVQPSMSWALTGGPAQPEFSSFTPIGVTDMVSLSGGDMNYNIPLMDVGGYPLNISYSASPSMDAEASWVGLGWDLSVGQINRNVRGLPDDFNGNAEDGDIITYENHLKPNITAGASFSITPALFGLDLGLGSADDDLSLSLGMSVTYNNYTGCAISPSVGVQMDLSNNVSVGFNVQSTNEGLCVSPNVSFSANLATNGLRSSGLGLNAGVAMNSRQGLTSTTFGAQVKSETLKLKGTSLLDLSISKDRSSIGCGSSIGFTDELYTPSKRVGTEIASFTVNAAIGGEIFGIEGQGQIAAFGTIVTVKDKNVELPAFGYSNTHLAGADGILDFNREKDGNVSINTNNLALTNYTYDIYSVAGQGVGGMYRPYRSQVGYVYDARVIDKSHSSNLGLEIGVGNTAHNGMDFEQTEVQGVSGLWQDNNGMLPFLLPSFVNPTKYETVFFKHVGDFSVDRDFENMFPKTAWYQPAKIPFVGGSFNRQLIAAYDYKIDWENYDRLYIGAKIKRTQRLARNQTIYNVTKSQVAEGIGYGPQVITVNHATADYAWPTGSRGHHTAEVQIVRNDGARYIYGLPAYNHTKVEATFAVEANGDCSTGLVPYSEGTLSSPEDLPHDQYLERITTPAFVHTHLLTSVLSTDYQDKDMDGPTPDDYGSYTKFSYLSYSDLTGQSAYKWRMPYSQSSYSEGFKTDPRDDRGNYVYGTKEMYMVEKIETKTHVAKFFVSARKDAHGVAGPQGGYNASNPSFKLDSIQLFSINEQSGLPIKVVHFEYDYSLCKNVPNSSEYGTSSEDNGKLTLKRIYFTYRGSRMGKYTDYEFTYSTVNPDYNIKGYDYWGNYKENDGGCGNLDPIAAAEYPYVDQNESDQNLRSEAWSLKTIKLPSGGEINVEYESDRYTHVQDRKAMRMFKVVGAGDAATGTIDSSPSAALFGDGIVNGHYNFIYVDIDDDPNATVEDYLGGITSEKLYFRFLMNMTTLGGFAGSEATAKYDYVTGYYQYDGEETPQIFTNSGDPSNYFMSIPVTLVDKEGGIGGSTDQVNPMAKAAWHFARKYLPTYAYSTAPNDETSDIQGIVEQMLGQSALSGLVEIFNGPNSSLENKSVGRRFIKEKSWVRLQSPGDYKLGGGSRVKTIRMSDIWDEMQETSGSFQTMNYGQSYEYLNADGTHSGVATYEPIGNKENPFVRPVFSTEAHLLSPDEENFIEEPFGESFFPTPQVTYARVKVVSLAGGGEVSGMQVKTLHRTGAVVSEFFTSRDYPTIVDLTTLQNEEDKFDALANLLKLKARKHYTGTQGYSIHVNDMNGKEKAKWVYAQGQNAPISGVRYIYDNHETQDGFSAQSYPTPNKGRLNNEVVVINPDGTVERNVIGVEIDVVNDLRENKTRTVIAGVNTNLANFLVASVPAMIPLPLPDISESENIFHSSVTTKVINTFGILKETIAYDAGAKVSTRNLAWDAETGEVLLTETVDEFDDRYYTLNYPAHWYYDGMGQAAGNIGLQGTLTSTGSGTFTFGSLTASDYFLPGDELAIVFDNGTVDTYFGWVTDVGTGSTFELIDSQGYPLVINGTCTFEIIRSGRRNLQSAGIMNVTLMQNPLAHLFDVNGALIANAHINYQPPGTAFLESDDWEDWKVINAGAVDYSDQWTVGCECGMDGANEYYNPYRINEKGVWRTKSSRTYLTGRNSQGEVTPRRQGFYENFAPMYKKVDDATPWDKVTTNWTFVAEVSQYSPYGFELENMDALNRFSAAQYGYNNTFPMAVGANTKYAEIGFDGFEDYGFDGCGENKHFDFMDHMDDIQSNYSHTGRYSIEVSPNNRATMQRSLNCD